MKVLVFLSLVAFCASQSTLSGNHITLDKDGAIVIVGNHGIEIDIHRNVLNQRKIDVILKNTLGHLKQFVIDEVQTIHKVDLNTLDSKLFSNWNLGHDYTQHDVLVHLFSDYQGLVDSQKYHNLVEKIHFLVENGVLHKSIWDVVKYLDNYYYQQGDILHQENHGLEHYGYQNEQKLSPLQKLYYALQQHKYKHGLNEEHSYQQHNAEYQNENIQLPYEHYLINPWIKQIISKWQQTPLAYQIPLAHEYYHQKQYPQGYYHQQGLYHHQEYPQGVYHNQQYPQGLYHQQEYSHGLYHQQGYPQGIYHSQQYPEGLHQEQEYSQGIYHQQEYPQGVYHGQQYPEGLHHEQEYSQGIYNQHQYPEGLYHQQEYSHGVYHQQQYPQGVYHQQEYPQGLYHQQEYSEGLHHQQEYPQGVYHQQEYPQGLYHQQGYSQGLHHQQEYPQGYYNQHQYPQSYYYQHGYPLGNNQEYSQQWNPLQYRHYQGQVDHVEKAY